MKYAYKAFNAQGKVVVGREEAPSAEELVSRLGERGLSVILVRPKPTLTLSLGEKPHPPRMLALLALQFSAMLEGGIPVLEALRTLSSAWAVPRIARDLEAAGAALERGGSLSQAFASLGGRWPEVWVSVIAAAEEGGFLEEALRRLAEHFDREDQLSQKIRSAVLYPKIVLGMAGAVFLLLVLFVIPRFAEVLELLGAGLPLPTRAALALGSALRGYWYLWLLAGVLGYLAFSWLRTQPEWEERVQRLSFRLPFFGPLRFREALARAISTLGTLLEGGVPVVEALRIAAATSGYRRLEAALRKAGEGVLRGEGLRRPLEESGAVPQEVTVMLGTGEEAGMLDRMCQRVARTLEREAEFLAQRLASSLEPVLIGVLGVIVGSVMLSVFIPVFHIYSSVLK